MYSINELIFLMETVIVYCEVGTRLLNICVTENHVFQTVGAFRQLCFGGR